MKRSTRSDRRVRSRLAGTGGRRGARSGILHDWDDKRAAAILLTIRAAAPADARLLVLDSIVPPGNEPHGAKWLDVLMLTLLDGRERDEEQWRALLGRAGFEPVRLEDDLIEARPR